jgi:D-alanyl-D-alanine carboxypeptidase
MLTAALAPLVLSLSLTLVPPAPVIAPPLDYRPPPEIGAEAWIVYDESTDVVLASWNADVRRSMASVTKAMTAMVVIDHTDLDDIVTIPDFVTQTRGSTAGLVAGEQWTVYDLLVAMLVRSGNDAALTLAWHVGSGETADFVALMNEKARELGLADTRFANPNGLDHAEHYSTANDLAALTVATLDYPVIGEIARIETVKLPDDPTGKERRFNNTNHLLGAFPGVVGLKTGDTPWANKVLLGIAERGPRRVVTVVMGTDDHFRDTRELLDWAYGTYGYRDRWLRPFFSEEGGGATAAVDLGLSDSQQRRLASMPALDDGRWQMSPLEELPKGEILAEWLRDALSGAVGGDG